MNVDHAAPHCRGHVGKEAGRVDAGVIRRNVRLPHLLAYSGKGGLHHRLVRENYLDGHDPPWLADLRGMCRSVREIEIEDCCVRTLACKELENGCVYTARAARDLSNIAIQFSNSYLLLRMSVLNDAANAPRGGCLHRESGLPRSETGPSSPTPIPSALTRPSYSSALHDRELQSRPCGPHTCDTAQDHSSAWHQRQITEACSPDSLVFVMPQDERQKLVTGHRRAGNRVVLEQLVPSSPHYFMQVNVHVIDRGGGSDEPISHRGQAFGHVLNGSLELAVNGNSIRLRRGGSFHSISSLSHSYGSVGESQTRVV